MLKPTETNRRQFISTTAKATAAVVLASTVLPALAKTSGVNGLQPIPFNQQPLGYAYNHLEAAIDALTMEIHYSKHAATYAKNLADAVVAEKVNTTHTSLETVLNNIATYSTKMRNNAGGHFNHEFFWQSMTGNSTQKPSGKLLENIVKDFGSFEAFKTQFIDAGKTRFGSGWAWLVQNKEGKLVIGSTPNQDNPLMGISELKGTPLLALDVWEHAYYLRYQNKRPDYINAWFNVVNWQMVEQRFS